MWHTYLSSYGHNIIYILYIYKWRFILSPKKLRLKTCCSCSRSTKKWGSLGRFLCLSSWWLERSNVYPGDPEIGSKISAIDQQVYSLQIGMKMDETNLNGDIVGSRWWQSWQLPWGRSWGLFYGYDYANNPQGEIEPLQFWLYSHYSPLFFSGDDNNQNDDTSKLLVKSWWMLFRMSCLTLL
jgi:hypothetical protein